MKKAVCLFLLLAGAALMVFGAVSNDSVLNSLSRFVTGKDADTAAWQLLAGGLVAFGGLVVGLWRPTTD
jgi:hypothetical protein